jgi:ligand-binding sensor domain-containing protein
MHIMRDSKGFMWASSIDGLSRWDGQNTKVYRTNPNDSNTIISNHITKSSEDQYGNIWVNHTMGLSLLKNNKFSHFTHTYEDTLSTYLGILRSGPHGEIFLSSQFSTKLDKFSPQINKFKNTELKGGLAGEKIMGQLSETQWDSSMYIYGMQGVFRFDPKTNYTERIAKGNIYTILNLFKDHQGMIWLGEWEGGLSIINEKTKEKINIFSDKRVSYITEYAVN